MVCLVSSLTDSCCTITSHHSLLVNVVQFVGLVGAKAAEAVGRNPGAQGQIMTIGIIFAALAEGLIFIAIFLGG